MGDNFFVQCIKSVFIYFFPGNSRKSQEGIVSNSTVYFTNHVPVNTVVGGPEPLKLRKILDMVSSGGYDKQNIR